MFSFNRAQRRVIAGLTMAMFSFVLAGCGDPGKKAGEIGGQGDASLAAGNYQQAISQYQQAREQAVKANDKASRDGGSFNVAQYDDKIKGAYGQWSQRNVSDGDAASAAGRPEDAIARYQEGIGHAQQAGQPTDGIQGKIQGAMEKAASDAMARGDSLLAGGQPASAIDSYKKGAEWATRAGKPTSEFDAKITGAVRAAATDAQAKGDSALAAGNPLAAVSNYSSALEYARRAGLETRPFEAKLGEARTASSDAAKRKIDEARNMMASNPSGAEQLLRDARSLAGSGSDANLTGQIDQLNNSPQMQNLRKQREADSRMASEMDAVTNKINSWLFMRSMYSSDPNQWGSYFRISSYMEMMSAMDHFDAVLSDWERAGHQTSSRARGQLQSMKSAFETWRLVAQLRPDMDQASGILMIRFLEAQMQLKATTGGTASINYWQLQSTWGVQYSGTGTGNGGFTYTGTGNGNGYGNGTGTGTGTGYGNGTGMGTGTGTGTGTGGYGTGGYGTGTGTGTGYGTGTGTGTGTGYGTGTGTGTGGYGTGTGTGRSTGTGTGTGTGRSTGTGTGTGSYNSGPGYDDLPRGTGSGTGRSTGTGTGTGSYNSGGYNSGTGTGTGTGTRSTGTGSYNSGGYNSGTGTGTGTGTRSTGTGTGTGTRSGTGTGTGSGY